MGLGIGIIPIAVFILAFAGTWSFRAAFNETIWFGGGWIGALMVIYAFDAAGYGFLSTSPTGPGGGVALIFGFAFMYYRRYRWRKDEAEKRRRRAEEQARRAAAGEPPPTSLLGNMGRSMGRAVNTYRSTKGK
jgi:hypothetical protein